MNYVHDEPEALADITQKQCYICLEVAEAPAEESRWVSPCRCTGTMAWVHQECILHWICELEKHNTPPACAQCLTRFVLIPEKGPMLTSLDLFYKRVVPVCKWIAGCFITVIAFDSACTTMGVFAMTQVYGVDETVVILLAYEDLMEAAVYMQLISYSLMLISIVPWEDCLLHVLRRSSRLPLLGSVFPSEAPVRLYELPRFKSTWCILADLLLLPVLGNIIGTLFFSSVKSPLSRTLIGGAVFFTLKCTFSMYLRQKLMIRKQNIQVMPLEDAAEAGE